MVRVFQCRTLGDFVMSLHDVLCKHLSAGGRSERLVNPLAWEKGMVIVQCEHCKAWHKVADANNMVEEYRFDEMQDSDAE